MDRNKPDKYVKPDQGKFDNRLAKGRGNRLAGQQQADEALLFIEDIIRCSSSAIAACDLEGNMTYGNPAFHQIWGFDDPKEVSGRSFWQFWLVEDRLDEIMQALITDGFWFDRIKARRNDGSIFDVQVSASMVFSRKGDPIALTSTSIDITESKRAVEMQDHQRELLQRIYDNIPVLLVMWDPRLRRFTLNRYAEAVLGWTTAEANEGDFMEKVYPDETYRTEVVDYMMSLKSGWREWINVTKEGERVPIDWANIRLSDDTVIGIGVDLRGRKQAEEAIRLAQANLTLQLSETERVNEELSQYAYAVSHDLKAPLRAIQNYADFLYEDLCGTLTGEQKDYLTGLKKAVAEGKKLIDDLLTYSRIDGVSPEMDTVDVPGLVNEIRSLIDLPSGVEIFVSPEWPHFNVIRTLLKQILQNLISNGVKFNKKPLKRIEIGWMAAPGESLDIYVRDNGIGIDPKYHQQIFRVFKRLHSDKVYRGTGIGLSIVKKAAEKMGGSVRLESAIDEGSTFYIRLPMTPTKTRRFDGFRKSEQL